MERMDGIIEENIKSFSKGFVDIQSRIAELEEENKKLREENKELKSDLKEQEAEGHGLFDEIDYRKREAKRLGWKPNN